MKDDLSVVLPIEIINCITKGNISKFLKKTVVKVCKFCKGEGFFRGANVHCNKCNRIGYTGSVVKANSFYKCKINRKYRCFYAKIRVTSVGLVVPADIISNESFSYYGFSGEKEFNKFMGKKNLNDPIWEIGFNTTSVVKQDDIRKMQKYDNGRMLDGSLPWT